MKILKTAAALAAAAALALSASAETAEDGGFDIDKTMGSVVVMYSDYGFGSGFAVGENCFVTNAHVAQLFDGEVKVRGYDDTQYIGYLIASDEERDLALVGIDDVSFDPITLGSSDETAIGETVYAFGSPKGMLFSTTKGILSRKDDIDDADRRIQSDAIICPGSSGGPLVDDSGRVIGVNTETVVDAIGLSLAVPSETVKEYIKEVGLKQDENGNVIERVTADEYAIDLPTHEQPETPEASAHTAVFSALGASELALGAAMLAAIAIIGIVVLILILRRTNERIKLLTYQLEQKNASAKEDKN